MMGRRDDSCLIGWMPFDGIRLMVVTITWIPNANPEESDSS